VADDYRYIIEYFGDDGARLGTVAAEPDWGPVLECAQFLGIRRGLLPARNATPTGKVEPQWHPEAGMPTVGELRVTVAGAANPEAVTLTVPRTYFRALAERGAEQLVTHGDLGRGQTFQYVVCAYPTDRRDLGDHGAARIGARNAEGSSAHVETLLDGLDVEEVASEIPIEERALEPFLACALPCGAEPDDDMPLLVPQHVVAEALAAAEEAGDLETGGILIGHLRRTPAGDEIFAEVTAQVPALHAESQSAKLTFTAETWSAARAAIDLRRRGELMLGWWHAHPNWCAKCPAENQARCAFRHDFFSTEDVHLHRTCFPRAYHVALLLSDHTSGMSASLFGWRRGLVVARQFHVFDTKAVAESERSSSDRGAAVTTFATEPGHGVVA
jgi:hypothetical protein